MLCCNQSLISAQTKISKPARPPGLTLLHTHGNNSNKSTGSSLLSIRRPCREREKYLHSRIYTCSFRWLDILDQPYCLFCRDSMYHMTYPRQASHHHQVPHETTWTPTNVLNCLEFAYTYIFSSPSLIISSLRPRSRSIKEIPVPVPFVVYALHHATNQPSCSFRLRKHKRGDRVYPTKKKCRIFENTCCLWAKERTAQRAQAGW